MRCKKLPDKQVDIQRRREAAADGHKEGELFCRCCCCCCCCWWWWWWWWWCQCQCSKFVTRQRVHRPYCQHYISGSLTLSSRLHLWFIACGHIKQKIGISFSLSRQRTKSKIKNWKICFFIII